MSGYTSSFVASLGSGRSSNSSANTRRNRPQRCSACGNLGHKSRTCPGAARRLTPSAVQEGVLQQPSQASEEAALLLALAAAPVLLPAAADSAALPACSKRALAEAGTAAKAMRWSVEASPRSSSEETPPASPPQFAPPPASTKTPPPTTVFIAHEQAITVPSAFTFAYSI